MKWNGKLQNNSTDITEEYLKKRKKRTWWIICGISFIIVLSTTIQTYIHQLTVPSPIAGNIVVFSLFNINIILLVILIILVLRNLIKLYFERKHKVIGYKFRTKLIIAFVLLSLIPSILLFWVASGFITSSIDNWFNIQVEKSLEKSLEVAQAYYNNTADRAIFYAEHIARIIAEKNMLAEENRQYLKNTIRKRLLEDRTDGIQILDKNFIPILKEKGHHLLIDINNIYISEDALKKSLKGEEATEVRPVGEGDLIIGLSPIQRIDNNNKIGIAAVSYYIPKSLVKKMHSITNAFEEYKQLKLLKLPIKASYVITFLMITLLILFSATWFGFYLAKGITVPIQELAEATRLIAEGNLDFQIDVKADDEIGLLVDSFNRMTEDLKISKATVEKASEDLKKTNIELDQRRSYIETVLENIATGVISIDKYGKISMANKSAAHILDISPEGAIGRPYREIFESSHLDFVRTMIKKMNELKKESIERELHLTVSGRLVTLLTNATVLKDNKGKYIGMVVVFDDLTELIKTQKIAAWREVARGIAHEIKNPLTPIQLNTQRLRKKFFEQSSDLPGIFEECTRTIINEVDGLKKLVNEFSKFARMPEPNPKPTHLHKIIDDVLLLYKGSAKNTKINTRYDSNINLLNIDAEQIKRVFINLIDNSLDAVNGSGEINIRTFLDRSSQTARIEFSDNGKGIPFKARNKIFMPYYSTKKGGAGLGLAIVNRIVADHDGSIKIQDNQPKGTTFTIKLPA